MNKYLIFLLASLILYSCDTKQENKTPDKASTQDTLAPLQVTVITNLHDSLQPKIFSLDTMPKALVVSAGKGEVKMLPVLQNEKGEAILDPTGKPFIMGNGGKSHFTNFSTDHGLALDGISSSIKDKAGNLWFGTYGGGVSRYDGKTFTSFTTTQGLANNGIWSILEDKRGNLWFGTSGGGVSRYDGKTFTNFTTTQGLANNGVWSILEDKAGNLWFGTNGGGVSRYDGKTFTSFTTAHGLAHNGVMSILEDETGNLWFGTNGGGVSRYDGKTFTNFTTTQGLANNDVRSILEDKTENLWFGTFGGGASRYDGKTFRSFTTAQGLANNNVSSILEDEAGNLWFGTGGGGVSRYDGKTFTSFATAQGLASNTVLSILEDKTGSFWFGTWGGGVSHYDGKAFTSFTVTQGLATNTVWSILEDKTGNLWFGTDGGGVSRFDGKTFTSFTTAQGLVRDIVLSILEDKTGNLWFGTDGGVSRYNGKTFTNFTTAQGLVNNTIGSILEDKMGNLWFGTDGGVNRYDGKTFTSFTNAQGLANNDVISILEDKTGSLWFGTDGGGVSRYDGKTFTNFTTAQGLANNTVFSILEDKTENLWFGTEEGLSVMSSLVARKFPDIVDSMHNYRGKDNTRDKLFTSFKIADGLPDNFVPQVIQLPNGKMAIGTNLGITLFNLSNDFTKLTNIEIFNSSTGYPVKDVNAGQNCMLLDSKGIIWAGTGSEKTGLVRFEYSALQKNMEPPALVIQSMKVEDENICWYNLETKGVRKNNQDSAAALLNEFFAYGKTLSTTENDSILKRFGNIQFDGITKFYPLPQNLVLPYEHNQVSFEFAAIETGRPFLVRYQYMLDGYDKKWSPVTDKSNAGFGNINEGTYTFKVKGRGANGVWTEPITYTFKVLPPWYRTWWAYIIYALLFLLALRIFSKWRERRLRAENERLEKKVEERTEELVEKNIIVEKEKQRSDALLLNILPEEVAEELKTKGSAEAKQFDEVTVLFTDFKNFTQISEKMTPKELVEEIHTCFKAFDTITVKQGIEKIKTIGDSYMCAGGLPVANKNHAEYVVRASLEIQEFILNRVAERTALGKESFQIRIGIHTGPVVAGIVGIKKFAYDIWGDTVNTASRMESSGEAGKVNISGTTYELVKDKFACTNRGKIQVKGKGEIDMYFVEGRT
jgi:ligand-binding sensor domain-containing protein